MTQDPCNSPLHHKNPRRRVWPWLLIVLLIICAVSASVLFRKTASPEPRSTAQTSAPAEPVPDVASGSPTTSPQPLVSPLASPATATIPPPALVLPEPTESSRALVASLARFNQSNSVTAEQAAEWKANLVQLVQQGASSVPAIREFLGKNVDMDFGPSGGRMLGYTSARVAMFAALQQIGGPEAMGVMLETLQTTADPREIALLAQCVESNEPDQHRQEILAAARQTLDQASGHKLETADVAPVFEVLQKYGAGDVTADLEKAARQWNYYGPIALGLLPDNAGVPSLVRIMQDPTSTGSMKDAAFEMLAQLSDKSPEARAGLLEQVRQNKVSDFAWFITGPILAGDQVGLVNSAFEDRQGLMQVGGFRTTSTSDNQHFYSTPVSLTGEEAAQRAAFLDELISVTSNPTTRAALQQTRDSLSSRARSVASSSGH